MENFPASHRSMMEKHLYNSRLGKVKWFIRRFGFRELFLKPVRVALAPAIIPRLRPGTFDFDGVRLEYFYHAYNMTWACERCLEVPIARHYLRTAPGGDILEVGNVLSHYGPVGHTILDKFEMGEGVINEDILSFDPGRRFGTILSISTFEHIGFDDEADQSSRTKILEAIAACRRLLAPDGKLVITVPVGYNPDLDSLIRLEELGATREIFLKRLRHRNWVTVEKGEALAVYYGRPFPYANAVLVAEFTGTPS